MTKEDYVMFAVFNILFFQGIPLPWQTKRTVFRDRPFPIIVVNKSTRRVPLYINLIGINVIIIIIIIIIICLAFASFNSSVSPCMILESMRCNWSIITCSVSLKTSITPLIMSEFSKDLFSSLFSCCFIRPCSAVNCWTFQLSLEFSSRRSLS